MRKYEMMLIYDVEAKPLEEIKEFVKTSFSAHGINVVDEKDIGMRDLAYYIEKKKRGYYYLFHFETEQNNLIKVDKDFKLYKPIVRYLTLKQD